MNDTKDSKILDGPIELFNLIVTSDSRWLNFETDYNVLIKYFIQKGRILFRLKLKIVKCISFVLKRRNIRRRLTVMHTIRRKSRRRFR